MSKESEDRDYKPTLHGRTLNQLAADRPRRNTRRQVDYTESVIILDKDDSLTGDSELEVVNTTQIREHTREGELFGNWARGSRRRPSDTEESDLGSESTIKYESEPEGFTVDKQRLYKHWSPRTLQHKTTGLLHSVQEVQQQIVMASEHTKSGANSMEAMMQLLLQARLDDQARDRKREEKREKRRQEEMREREKREARRIEEEYEREERRQQREEKLLLAIKEAQPAVPQTVQINSCKLPKMKEGEDITSFIKLFEAALQDYNIPPLQWKARVHNAMDTATKLRVRDTITNHDSTYLELKTALLGCSSLSFNHASDTIMTGDRGSIFSLPPRQAFQRWQNLLERLTREATDIKSVCAYMAAALLRFNCSVDLKTYLDTKGDFDRDIFCRNIEEWLATRPAGVTWAKQSKQANIKTGFGASGQKRGTCFHCGKAGHFAFECKSRLAGDKPAPPRQEPPPHTQHPVTRLETPRVAKGERDMSQVTCFRCRQQGHISPNCPKKPASKIKRVQVTEDLIQTLKENEVFGAVGPYRIPITLDTGADITVVPEEAVEQDQFTGETCELRSFNDGKSRGRKCVVKVTVGEHKLTREAVTQPGNSLGWSVCLRVNLADSGDRSILLDQIIRRADMQKKDLLYVPPKVREEFLLSGILVEEAQVVKGVKWKPPSSNQVPVPAATAEAPEPVIIQGVHDQGYQNEGENDSTHEVEVEQNEEEGDRDEVAVTAVEGNSKEVLVMEEVDDSTLGGSADRVEFPVAAIREGMPRREMAMETATDTSLQAIRKLAELEKEGFHLSQGLIWRTRLDSFGKSIQQLCVPPSFRRKCLTAAHNSFGHQGRNKMVELLRPYFYWPNQSRTCRDHVRQCSRCQAADKSSPKPHSMTARPVVTQPFKDVAIDWVGPFPTATGGFQHMLTCVDMATRWPEAIPVRSTTSRTVITCLTRTFSRTGFPEKITTDNGPQFISNEFTTWLKQNGIAHSKATPYHPQGNGVVEHLHRTLNAIVLKTIESRGNWARVLPLALYFIRCTPSASTGVSPFMLTHGWEPRTPLQVLYQSWVKQDLQNLELTDWILENQERVESARDQATSNLIMTATKRSEAWDRQAVDRYFRKGDTVWMRRLGLNHKLQESWTGPCTIVKRTSPVSYRVQTEHRQIPTVHVQQLKAAYDPKPVKRITAVVQETDQEDLTTSFAAVNIQSQELTVEQQTELQQELSRFTGVLTKEPGLTDLATFDIDMGEADPIQQRPYSTPVALKAKVDDELTWLLQKGYIAPSSSPWASPMVTVHKADGSARLCVDIRKINSLTRPMPFFMPRVEEVVEGIGKAKYISKLDLAKGFYQVPLTKTAMEKTAFTCHKGNFHFTRMPFGVKNAPACFQILMQRVLGDVTDF